jgi:hypothetical protein
MTNREAQPRRAEYQCVRSPVMTQNTQQMPNPPTIAANAWSVLVAIRFGLGGGALPGAGSMLPNTQNANHRTTKANAKPIPISNPVTIMPMAKSSLK